MAEKQNISIDKMSFSYGDSMLFSEFSMELPASGVSVILGPSGCGKTTLLNLISGLIEPDQGVINRGGREGAPGNTSLLFQEPRLLPWRTIRQNVELVLKKHYGTAQSRSTAEHYLELVGLADFLDYYPEHLSGGMRQRAAIARAFAYPAEIILMDEPFQALDLGLKISLTRLFSELWIKDGRTAVFVTHDINEAILLGNEIFVLSSGRPVEILEHITNLEPQTGRNLDSQISIDIEKRLFKLLSNLIPENT